MNVGRRVRLLLALLIFLISLAFLLWGFLPSVRERRIRRFDPGELQIPTPAAVLPEPAAWSAVLGLTS